MSFQSPVEKQSSRRRSKTSEPQHPEQNLGLLAVPTTHKDFQRLRSVKLPYGWVCGAAGKHPTSPSKGRKTFSLSALYINLNRGVSYRNQ